jgi:tRNA threonylcarbamoyladenosine biosynthesis protein TsaE
VDNTKGEKIFITNSFEETQKLGEEFAKSLKHGEIIALYGDLGSGKTTFVQGLAKGFWIKRRIISPTFIIVRSYKLGIGSFYHIDLYRIQGEKEIESLGIEEIIKDPQNIVVIEWAENMERFLPKERWDVRFEYAEGNKRRIAIKKFSIRNLKFEIKSKFENLNF